jgi:hypothetical protein
MHASYHDASIGEVVAVLSAFGEECPKFGNYDEYMTPLD